MNILVTGGMGYIGTTLIPKLLYLGHSVTCVDNLYWKQYPELLRYEYGNVNFEFIHADLTSDRVYKSFLNDYHAIIHLAAIVGAPACDKIPEYTKKLHVDFTRDLINNLDDDQILIYPNTNSGYGATTGEEYCDENTPMNPISLYGSTKCEAEKIVLEHKKSVVFRLATVFGLSQRMRLDLLVNNFCYKAAQNIPMDIYEGHFKRNFVHIDDVAYAFMFALDNKPYMYQNVYNLGNDESNMSKMDLVNMIKEICPNWQVTEGDGEDLDKRNYIVSNEKLAKTGFRATKTVQDSIECIIDYCEHLPTEATYSMFNY